jgi:hypothetical protein
MCPAYLYFTLRNSTILVLSYSTRTCEATSTQPRERHARLLRNLPPGKRLLDDWTMR